MELAAGERNMLRTRCSFFQGPGLHEHYGSNPEETHRKLLGALPRVAPQSPPTPLSTSSSVTVWSTPTSKGVALPLDPTNPWAEDVLRLCEKQGQEVAGRFDLSPAMAGRRISMPTWGYSAQAF
mmetsp:Transcript_34993/g.71898  ORF Transcript_34993/g.71898 Transcript_34993/m.71898 type:complete len:124 (-) Transcript_34993:292-663(-)